MDAKRVEIWVWVLVYAGLIVVGLGLALRQSGAPWGSGVALIGAILVALGAVLIWARSRMNSPP